MTRSNLGLCLLKSPNKSLLAALVIFLAAGAVTLAQRKSTDPSRWSATRGKMLAARSNACSVLLPNGSVLITGGVSGKQTLSSSEFYESGSFSVAPRMAEARSDHACAVLPDGTVLVAGGRNGSGMTNTTEIFDADANAWKTGPTMPLSRAGASFAVLKDGRLLLAGGEVAGVISNDLVIFDATSATFHTVQARLSSPRRDYGMASLKDGRVLIVGGFDGENVLDSIDLFDPSTGMISRAGKLSLPRSGLSATTLLDGRVVFLGGGDSRTEYGAAEIYNPKTGAVAIEASMMAQPRRGHAALRVANNNTVLLIGGTAGGQPIAQNEAYIPWRHRFQPSGTLAVGRTAATVLSLETGGQALVAGGAGPLGVMATAHTACVPTVTTDQADYAPGTTVTMTGSCWQPGGAVQITMTESPDLFGESPITVAPSVVAADGTFTNTTFAPDDNDLGVAFFLTATESVDGNGNAIVPVLTAQTSFTDSDNTATAVSCTPNSVVVGSATTCTATVVDTKQQNPQTPTGKVTFSFSGIGANGTFNPSTGICTLSGSGGTASCHVIFTPSAITSTTITADYPGVQGTFQTSNGSTTLTVNPGARITRTDISLNPTTLQAGQTSTVTVTVTDNASGQKSAPTGTVTITSDKGDTFTGPCTLGSPQSFSETCSVTLTASATSGIHSITGSYPGDSNHAPSSNSAALTVQTSAGTTTTATSPTVSYGQAATSTVTVTANSGSATPTGTVAMTASNGGSATCSSLTGSGTSATSTCTITYPATGTFTLGATYTPSGNFTGSTASGTLIVNAASTTTAVSAPGVTYNANGSVTVTVSSSGGTPTGNVTLTVDSGTPVSQPLTNGASTFTVTSPNAGAHNLSASYLAQGNFGASSNTATLQVSPAATTTAINSPTITYSTNGSVTVTVSSAAGPPTGDVSLTVDNGAALSQPLSNGSSTFSLSSPNAGDHTLAASYAAQGNFAASSSTGGLHVNPSITTAGISAASITYGANGSVTVTISSAAGTPAGTVSLTVDSGAPISQALASGSSTFSVTSPNAGDHSLSASYAAQGNFGPSSITGSLHVSQATPNVTVNGGTFTYDTTVHGATCSAAGVNNASVSGSCSFTYTPSGDATAPTNAGTYSVHASFTSGNPNYTNAEGTGSITVNPANQSITNISPATGATAQFGASFAASAAGGGSGNPVAIAGSGGCSGGGSSPATITMTSGALDCTLTFTQAGNSNYSAATPGAATIHATPAPQTVTFVNPSTPPRFGDGTFTEGVSATSGAAVTVISTTSDVCTVDSTATSVAVTITKAGSCTLSGTIASDGNYAAAGNTTTVLIRQYTIPACLSTGCGTTGSSPNPGGSVSIDSSVPYLGTVSTTINLSPLNLSGAPLLSDGGNVTDNPKFTVYLAAVDGSGARIGTPVLLGSAKVTTSPSGYAAIVSGTLPSTFVPGAYKAYVYGDDGDTSSSNVAPKDAGFTAVDSVDFIYPTLSSNVLTVTKAAQSITFGALSGKTYGDAAFTVSATGGPSGSPVTFTATGKCATSGTTGSTITITGAGSCTVTANQAGNSDYEDATPVLQGFNIAKATLTVTADDKTNAYGAALPELTASYSGFVYSDSVASLSSKAILSSTALSQSHVAGSPYSITAASAVSENYSFVYKPGKLTVTAVPLTITADPQSKLYGAALPTLTVSYGGLVNGDTPATFATAPNAAPSVTTTATAASHIAGSPYSITASGAIDTDYTITYNAGTLTVTPAILTITADSKTKIYGAAMPGLTASYTGFVNTDTAANLTVQPGLTTTATAGSHVAGSPYPITASGAVGADYSISYVAGTLTVTPTPLTVTAENKTKGYGAALPTFTATYSGFVNNDTSASLTTAPTLTTTAIAASHVAGNPYPITPSGAVAADYNFSYVAGALTVTAVPLTIKADNATKVYGSPLPAFTATYSGLVNGDTPGSLSTQPTIAPVTAISGLHVAGSPYALQVTGAVDSDYTITPENGSLTVTPAPLTITAVNQTKVYGAPLPGFTATYSGLVNGDTPASLSTPPTLSTTALPGSPIGPYSITASGAIDTDYAISYSAGILTVTPAPTTTALTSSLSTNANPVVVTLTANVSSIGSPAVPAGAVTFTDTFTNAALSAPVMLNPSGTAQTQISLASGQHTIVATYSPTLNFIGSNSTASATAPSGALITAPALTSNVFAAGASVSLKASYTGSAASAQWSFVDGDGKTAGSVSGTTGAGIATGSTSFGIANVYTITITLNDGAGGIDIANTLSGNLLGQAVVYDPTAGFVTGGGWINSMPGSYTASPTLTGQASFGFVSKYQKGANVPTGNTEFNFQVANFAFHGSVYQWLVVSGKQAQYKGTGTINNGTTQYNFMLTCADPNGFRIKITDSSSNIVYDNMIGYNRVNSGNDGLGNTQPIGGGSIQIHN